MEQAGKNSGLQKQHSQEYLRQTRDQPMSGPFPAPPIFKGKSPGDEVVAAPLPNLSLPKRFRRICTLL